MKAYKFIENILKKWINRIWIIFVTIHEYKNIFKKRKLFKYVKLTKKQKEQIDDFYKKNYGKKVRYWWHRLYQSYTGNFDYQYVPEILFSTKMELKANKRLEVLPYEDKNMLSVIFQDEIVKTPQTYIMCVKGKFFNEKRNFISKQDAIDIIKNITEKGCTNLVAKITVDTNSGKGVKILQLENGTDKKTNQSIQQIISNMGDNFVIQEKIEQHEAFSKLNASSVNTLRVVTYMTKKEIAVAPIIMRIGQGGALVDNAHAGGMFIGVSDEGRLLKEAYTEYQNRYTKHPDTGIVFEGYMLPYMEEVKKSAIRLHRKLPMLDYVSWDFTVDKDGNIVLIEANLHSQTIWLAQMAHGKSFFGNNTAEMLNTLKNKKRGETF